MQLSLAWKSRNTLSKPHTTAIFHHKICTTATELQSVSQILESRNDMMHEYFPADFDHGHHI